MWCQPNPHYYYNPTGLQRWSGPLAPKPFTFNLEARKFVLGAKSHTVYVHGRRKTRSCRLKEVKKAMKRAETAAREAAKT